MSVPVTAAKGLVFVGSTVFVFTAVRLLQFTIVTINRAFDAM